MKFLLLALVFSMPMFASAQLVKPILECAKFYPVGGRVAKGDISSTIDVNYLPQNKAYVMTVTQSRLENTVPWPTYQMVGQSHERVVLYKSNHYGEPTAFKGATYALSVNLSALPMAGRYPGVLVRIATGESIVVICEAK